ncbi:(R)-mandelonitrile lyase [Rubrivivax gelatinosus]|uniref:Quercetin dioxygenase-like cupin family protein n=1 Tax=Rubrivivax gelatinosus TaxID=28068 RepID=A0A4R2MFL3_RUBGE|nr:cupin domain-containing protein [Rubrivivax gelatinosus]MBK1685931.1 cupin [Rubrivivax gelatinosus]TCP04045.1 quercetin dioxygenase-like cupin family protein [Rubrivivax gelatinosus]
MKPDSSNAVAAALLTAAACLGPEACVAREPELVITRVGSTPSAVGAEPANFSGRVRVDMLHLPVAPGRASAASVSFEAGARTVWHTHPLGQTLVVTSGLGRVQRAGGPVETIRPGDVVWIPPGVKHWHGASPTVAMTHLAITEALDGQAVVWFEPVVDTPATP